MNYRLTLSYDGTKYRGWQRQANTPNTIQGKLEAALAAIAGMPVEVVGSGRTDAGVHAAGQVASFRLAKPLDPHVLCAKLRTAMPQDIGILSVEKASDGFHARFSAKEKTYCYRIWNSEQPNVFERRFLWQVAEPLDREAMQACLPYFLGTHDFRAFCSNPPAGKSTVRTIRAIRLEEIGSELRLTVTGDGFLYNMVRLIAGTMLRAGKGEINPDAIPAILESGERYLAGPMAPACGLCMMEVRYE